ncbi:MAG TPA: hypothetical protein VMI75_23630 [Polyangiaceae bacterium]|nr:hypothetical protein [Polyangiaceae bacterium]
MRLSPSRLAVPLAAVVLSFSMTASAQDLTQPPVAPATPAPAAAPPAAAPAAPAAAPAEASPTERTANNALYIELLGAGLFYSLDYDRAFGPVSGRIGIGYFSISSGNNASGGSSSATFISVPVTVSYLGIGSLKHMFEVGAGVSINYFGGSSSFAGVSTSGSATEVFGTVVLGYRYQPPDGGFFLRAGIDPIIGSFGFLPWPYVGLGATF